ncbi:hypothetical protein [Saccharopolyspora elongata]|uniref:Uncharacterized protein n=1 Tax=Saccharopolyspora elongata TaxID=2530387 RepID=A0A4R4YC66_9PSEU|nr:hypothetical protein [Saccharopolyspora elongata]TDD42201.1 hypothetical protein E1288_30195 [Saccharopolyspora elongata]
MHIRRPDESEAALSGYLDVLARQPGVAVVAATEGALNVPSIPSAVRQACALAVEEVLDAGSAVVHVCLALPEAASPSPGDGQVFAQQLAEELGVGVIATNTGIVAEPVGSLFSGSDQPGHGWYRFRRGWPAEWIGHRYPAPGWENLLPRTDIAEGGLSLVPIPAGLMVCRSDALTPGAVEEARGVPVHPGRPRLVLGHPADGEISALAVAEFLRKSSPQFLDRVQLVPTDLQTSSARWNQRLADLLGRPVVASTGVISDDGAGGAIAVVHDGGGEPTWQPPALALRYAPGKSAEVVETAPPPRGWLVFDPVHYRQAPPPGAVAASGGWLARVVPSGLALLPIGQDAGEADSLPFEPNRMTVTVACPEECEVSLMGPLRSLLDGLPMSSRERMRLVTAESVPPGLADEIRELADVYGAQFERGTPAVPAIGTSIEPAGEQRTLVMAPVSGKAAQSGANAEPGPGEAKTRILPVPVAPALREPEAALLPAPRSPSAPGGSNDCSALDRQEFVRWSGKYLDDVALPVDITSATSADARIDYAAVLLYLGRGEWSGAALNNALRSSGTEVPAHYVACLTAGLTRLPSHCGVVFLRVTDRAGLDSAYSAGDVLAEPAFLSAMGARTRAVADDCGAELVIWSRTARRTAAVNPDPADEVVFPAGSRFKVLAVDPPTNDSARIVFLVELPSSEIEVPGEPDLDRVLVDELRAALRRGRRDHPVEMTEAQAERCDIPVGLVPRRRTEVDYAGG